jgi:transcriptional regulator with XRE-family HTH domain
MGTYKTGPRTHVGPTPSILRGYRNMAGILQVDLAKAAGIQQATLSRFEQGRTTPTAEIKERLAKALNTTTAELFPDPPAEERHDPDRT